jgi:hypothetical protein
VLDTSPFRIAIVYSIVFACGAAVLLGAVDFAVSRVVDSSTDNLIEAEVQGLREQVLVLSRGDFIELIEQRSQDQDVRGAVYLMVDPQLRPSPAMFPPGRRSLPTKENGSNSRCPSRSATKPASMKCARSASRCRAATECWWDTMCKNGRT